MVHKDSQPGHNEDTDRVQENERRVPAGDEFVLRRRAHSIGRREWTGSAGISRSNGGIWGGHNGGGGCIEEICGHKIGCVRGGFGACCSCGVDEEERHRNGGGRGQGKECDEDRNELLFAQVEDTGTFHGVVAVNGQYEVAYRAACHWEELQRCV